MLEGQGAVCVCHNGHTDNCGADIPFQLVALLVGRLAALHRYWLSSKFLSTTVRTHLGTQDFVAVYQPNLCGFSQGVQAVHQAFTSCVSPIESLGFSDFLIRSVDGGSEDVCQCAVEL